MIRRALFSMNARANWIGISLQHTKCWNCAEPHDHKEGVFCKKCKKIQPVRPDSDYFSYMGVEQSFKQDEETLKNKFRDLQSVVHPDKFGTRSDKEQEISEQHSSYLNRAYKTLQSPRERAKYLLRVLNEGPLDDEVTADFAAEMFEYVEELENETNYTKLKKKADHVDASIEELLIQIENAFDKGDSHLAKELLIKLRYFDRAKTVLDKKLSQD